MARNRDSGAVHAGGPSGPAGGAPARADAYYLPILRPGLPGTPFAGPPGGGPAIPGRRGGGAVSGPAARPRRDQPTVTGGFRCCGGLGPDHPSQ